jgi:hypothetical protein
MTVSLASTPFIRTVLYRVVKPNKTDFSVSPTGTRMGRLDGLLYHQSEVAARRHHTDGGGDSDHVFALCSLLGFQFAPRIPDLKRRRLYSFGKAAYPSLEPLIAGRINKALIRAHWPEILRVAASIHTGTVAASLILRQLASYPRQNGLAAALRELGRHPVEYAVPRARRCRSAPDRGCSGSATRSPLPARLGACEPHRGLHLGVTP